MNKVWTAPIALLILLVAFIVMCNPIALVGVGECGVKVTLGKVDDSKIYPEGIHFVMPFISRLSFHLGRNIASKCKDVSYPCILHSPNSLGNSFACR